jgi:Na+-transporting methylmalonyl-CoA/oxaloacetate decarboxylase gamma subunit
MNNVFTFVVIIVIVVSLSELAKTYIKQRDKKPESNEDLDETIKKIEALEERIQVLERIVTEKRYDLKKEIDDL